jgi:hypothetical protein
MPIGKSIDHRAAKGDLPQADVPAPSPLDEWTLFEGDASAGLEVRWHDGRKEYRAVVQILDELYPGDKGPVYSKVYEARDDCDVQPVSAYEHINPGAEMQRRAIEAGVARGLMDVSTQAAPSDMRRYLADLHHELLTPYMKWQREQQRHADRLGQTATLRAQIAVMLEDIEANGMTDEYKVFIDSLQKLLQISAKGKK